MAQTRKKRRSKHRGTAAGTIESRGRTGRKLSEKERSAPTPGSRGSRAAARMDKPPTWRSAFFRALMACVLLFVFTRVGFGPDVGIPASIALCLLALAIYVPLGYATDMFVYRRRQRRKAVKS
jgi:Flp pilus assembly protein TadB